MNLTEFFIILQSPTPDGFLLRGLAGVFWVFFVGIFAFLSEKIIHLVATKTEDAK